MNKITALIITFVLLITNLNLNIYSHELYTDKNIGISFQASNYNTTLDTEFQFHLKDKNRKFQGKNCLCQLTTSKEGQNVFSSSLNFTDSLIGESYSTLKYKFRNQGNYVITITGLPKQLNQFMNFQIKFSFAITDIYYQLVFQQGLFVAFMLLIFLNLYKFQSK
jgi:hypothetical protein